MYRVENELKNPTIFVIEVISFLLEIPAVRSLAHLQIWDGGVNELFRAALCNGNQAAAEILLAIPAVKDSAADDDYYRDEVPADIDLYASLGYAAQLVLA